jgi:hypothetical protein
MEADHVALASLVPDEDVVTAMESAAWIGLRSENEGAIAVDRRAACDARTHQSRLRSLSRPQRRGTEQGKRPRGGRARRPATRKADKRQWPALATEPHVEGNAGQTRTFEMKLGQIPASGPVVVGDRDLVALSARVSPDIGQPRWAPDGRRASQLATGPREGVRRTAEASIWSVTVTDEREDDGCCHRRERYARPPAVGDAAPRSHPRTVVGRSSATVDGSRRAALTPPGGVPSRRALRKLRLRQRSAAK